MNPLRKQMDMLESRRLAAVLPHIRGRLLDVGCGYNNLVQAYGGGVGADIHVWNGIDVQIGDATTLPFPDNHFDTVTIVAALNHVPDREAALKEAWRVLCPSGKLLVTMIGPLTGQLAHLVFRHDEAVRGGLDTGEVKGMSREEVCDLLGKSGFALIEEHRFELRLNTLFVAEKRPDVLCTEQKSKVSIIIPVYNEQSSIGEVIDRVCAVELGGLEKEIIIADDGSLDDTPSIIAEKHKQHPCIAKVHTSLINLGKGAAIRLGLEFTRGDIILIQDADLELDPAEFPVLLAPILRGKADVVYGSRFRMRSSNIPLRTRLANRFLTLFTNLLYGSKLTDMATAYKVFRSDVIRGLELRSARFEFEPEVTAKLLMAGYKIVEVPISYNPRTVDEGKKVGWIDGVEYIYTLLKYRFFDG
jgi:hypothetical protein